MGIFDFIGDFVIRFYRGFGSWSIRFITWGGDRIRHNAKSLFHKSVLAVSNSSNSNQDSAAYDHSLERGHSNVIERKIQEETKKILEQRNKDANWKVDLITADKLRCTVDMTFPGDNPFNFIRRGYLIGGAWAVSTYDKKTDIPRTSVDKGERVYKLHSGSAARRTLIYEEITSEELRTQTWDEFMSGVKG